MPSEHQMPDGLLGALFALEGVRNSVTILNGPTGCKYYPASLSDSMFQREISFNPLQHVTEFYFGQPRIPCTYMDSHDYIMGAEGKLHRIFRAVEERRPDFIGVVNSPGASLIGEGLRVDSQDIPVARMESPGYSESISEGYQRGVLAILEAMDLQPKERKIGQVNLLGLSIWHLGWEDSLQDLRHLLHLCGLELCIAIGAGWTASEIRESASSSLNVVVDKDFCSRICRWYEEELGVPHVDFDRCPLGFDALEDWVAGICAQLDADPGPAMGEIKSRRRLAYREISRLNAATGLPKGRTFSVSAHASLALPVIEALHSYLGMVPVAVKVCSGDRGPIDSYLSRHGLTGLDDDLMESPVDIALADGNTIAALMAKGLTDNGLDIIYPGLRSVQLRPEPVLGLEGTMRLLDRVLNSLAR
ncbi:MAG: nitrogenase component 1 [Candidatus Methanomethylophilaceae archaeon]|nr:nitrogenase component 1 [Candidatus Methanomethylophilaceae archaeon]